MLVTADWVLPISRRPIRDGGVLVDGDVVAAVGTADELAHSPLAHDVVHLPDCVLMPGLVNAHTHLVLSALSGLIEPGPFESWLPQLVTAARTMDAHDHEASAALGALECLRAGVTVVGDIAYGAESARAAARVGVGGTFFWEVLGIAGPSLFAELERLDFPVDCFASYGNRLRCGLSPHSPYTSAPDLLRAVRTAALEGRLPVAIHIAESAAETALTSAGAGPLAPVAERIMGGFSAPGTGPVEYLDRLGVLDGVTAIHLGEATPADIPRLAATVRGAVTCPRSNHFLENRIAPAARLRDAGIPVGIGTDSSASNNDLDLFEEVRLLHSEEPGLSPADLLAMVTAEGATAIGLEDRFGLLEPGMQADLAAFCIGGTDDPETDTVRLAGSATLDSVMSGGVWRVRAGQLLPEHDDILSAAQAVTMKARASLDRS